VFEINKISLFRKKEIVVAAFRDQLGLPFFFMEIVILISWGIWMTYSGFNFRKRAADTTTYIIHFPKESLPWLF